MDETKFEVGDVVQLKSGGPRMTISMVEKTTVIVIWFDTHYHLQEGHRVNMALLKKFSLPAPRVNRGHDEDEAEG